jgi:hypothetical protein
VGEGVRDCCGEFLSCWEYEVGELGGLDQATFKSPFVKGVGDCRGVSASRPFGGGDPETVK